jgi:hypothetical protein
MLSHSRCGIGTIRLAGPTQDQFGERAQAKSTSLRVQRFDRWREFDHQLGRVLHALDVRAELRSGPGIANDDDEAARAQSRRAFCLVSTDVNKLASYCAFVRYACPSPRPLPADATQLGNNWIARRSSIVRGSALSHTTVKQSCAPVWPR